MGVAGAAFKTVGLVARKSAKGVAIVTGAGLATAAASLGTRYDSNKGRNNSFPESSLVTGTVGDYATSKMSSVEQSPSGTYSALPNAKPTTKIAANENNSLNKLMMVAINLLSQIDSHIKSQLDASKAAYNNAARADREKRIEAGARSEQQLGDATRLNRDNGAGSAGSALAIIAPLALGLTALLGAVTPLGKALTTLKDNIYGAGEKLLKIGSNIAQGADAGITGYSVSKTIQAAKNNLTDASAGVKRIYTEVQEQALIAAGYMKNKAGRWVDSATGWFIKDADLVKTVNSSVVGTAVKKVAKTGIVSGVFESFDYITGNKSLRNKRDLLNSAGGIVGGIGGAAGGALAGTAVAPGIGTAVGGIAGGVAGDYAGRKAADGVSDYMGWKSDSKSTSKPNIAGNSRVDVPGDKVERLDNNQKRLAARAMQILQSEGKFTKEQAAGIVGNLIAESGLDVAGHGDKKLKNHAFGIGQWRDVKPGSGRFTDLLNFAKSQNKPWKDFDTQVRFIIHELNGTENRAKNKLLGARTSTDAAGTFAKYYERPEGSNKAGYGSIHSIKRRIGFAANLAGEKINEGIELASTATSYAKEKITTLKDDVMSKAQSTIDAAIDPNVNYNTPAGLMKRAQDNSLVKASRISDLGNDTIKQASVNNSTNINTTSAPMPQTNRNSMSVPSPSYDKGALEYQLYFLGKAA